MSDTPRTDAVAEQCVGEGSPMSYVRAIDLARQLERELAAKGAEITQCHALIKALQQYLNAKEAENAELRAAGLGLLQAWNRSLKPDGLTIAEVDKARQAMHAALKGSP